MITSLYCDGVHYFSVVSALEVLLSRLDMLPTSGATVGDFKSFNNLIHHDIDSQDRKYISYYYVPFLSFYT